MNKKDNKTQMQEDEASKPSNADRWFDAQLTRLYTDVANEPLPDDLEQLVKQLIEKTEKNNKND